MEVSVEINDDVATIKVAGELIGSSGLINLDETVNEQSEAGYKKIILDISKTAKIDSTGLGALINIKNSVDDAGGQIVFFSTCEQVNAILKTTKINKEFIVCDSLDQALLQF